MEEYSYKWSLLLICSHFFCTHHATINILVGSSYLSISLSFIFYPDDDTHIFRAVSLPFTIKRCKWNVTTISLSSQLETWKSRMDVKKNKIFVSLTTKVKFEEHHFFYGNWRRPQFFIQLNERKKCVCLRERERDEERRHLHANDVSKHRCITTYEWEEKVHNTPLELSLLEQERGWI